jgi:hypothetical protein
VILKLSALAPRSAARNRFASSGPHALRAVCYAVIHTRRSEVSGAKCGFPSTGRGIGVISTGLTLLDAAQKNGVIPAIFYRRGMECLLCSRTENPDRLLAMKAEMFQPRRAGGSARLHFQKIQ